MEKGLCLITFSNNADHQNVVYSMFKALKDKENIYTIGIKNPKSDIAQFTERNFYFDCPLRPGITKGTFRFNVLLKMAKVIKDNNIKYLYFESMHLWNPLLMMLCPGCVSVVAVHDVIPHDGNKAMDMCNYVCCKMAHHIVLRNYKYKDLLAKKCKIDENKITSFELWRDFDDEIPAVGSKRLLCFGRIRKYKGFDYLEEIIKNTPDVIYDVVGSPDEESMGIVEKIKKLPNANVVDKEVDDAEMKEYFKNADWIILPYSSATQSGVIVDAYRMSRPIIAFSVGAISEQVKDGETGFLVPAGDVGKFVETVNKVNDMTKSELDGFVQRAYQYGYNKYAAEAVADDFLKIILNL
jgi:glycosyltransferase involved in cell wall biosynthesis